MPKYSENKILPFLPNELFDLVADVENYPDFVPWCVGTRVYGKKKTYIDADMMIGYKWVRETFTSRVHLIPYSEIDIEYKKGPFRNLTNTWKFSPVGEKSCEISFLVEFEFKSKFLEKLIGTVFTEAVHRMVTAFEKRAHELYG